MPGPCTAGLGGAAGARGVLYTVGGVTYARKKPNPHPQWFGFHELFHSLTIAAHLVEFIPVAQL